MVSLWDKQVSFDRNDRLEKRPSLTATSGHQAPAKVLFDCACFMDASLNKVDLLLNQDVL